MKHHIVALALISLSLALQPAQAQGTKPKSVVLGTNQLPGEFGKIGTTYTIGKERPLNFTLISAEYRGDRFVGGNFYDETESFVPLKNQKLLVIKYTVQNPKGADARLWYNSFEFTAVSPDSANTKMLNHAWINGQTHYKEVQLKPGEKVSLTGAFYVAGDGEVPKLIVQREQDPKAAVIRYDLRGKVAKIADPAFSDDGISTKDTIEGKVGAYYPWLGSDFQVVGTEDLPTNIPDLGTPTDYKQVAIKLKFKGITLVPGRVWYGDFVARVTTSDGETTEVKPYYRLYRGARVETFDGVVPVGEEQNLRFVVDVPKSASVTAISLSCRRNEDVHRTFKFKLAS